MEVGDEVHALAALPPEYRTSISVLHEIMWIKGPVCTDMENRKSLVPTEV
jgi:hypothetical protein